MSRAHEAFLTNHLARLDHWITESEALASRSSDDETLRIVKEELVRLHDLRRRYQTVLRRTKSLNRLAWWALAVFCTGFLTLIVTAIVQPDLAILAVLVAAAFLSMVVAGIVYVGTIVVRDAIAMGRQPWQFSLRSLIVATTVIAALLYLLVYGIGN
jgi:hypothetical protein